MCPILEATVVSRLLTYLQTRLDGYRVRTSLADLMCSQLCCPQQPAMSARPHKILLDETSGAMKCMLRLALSFRTWSEALHATAEQVTSCS